MEAQVKIVGIVSGCARQHARSLCCWNRWNTYLARRYEALEERMEALREERRPGSTTAPPELLARHAAEIENLTLELASLQVRMLCADSSPQVLHPASCAGGFMCCQLLSQEDFDSYRTTAEAVAEEKDAELARVLEGNATLREQLAQAQAMAAQVSVPPPLSAVPQPPTRHVQHGGHHL